MFNEIYKNKRVLITGHTGFKGAWLSLWLKKLGAEVIGYSLYAPSEPNLFDALGLKNEITSIKGDVRDEKLLCEVFELYQPEIVFHLAAQALVVNSYHEPKLTFETNVMGSVSLFEAARKTKSVKVVVNVTTDKCYENNDEIYEYKETDKMGGYDPYSASKGASELITSSYRNSFFNQANIALASARAGNVIGGGDWAQNRIIPDFIKSAVAGEKLDIRNPNALRPWQFVLEPLSGYLWLGAKLWEDKAYAQAWNFGPEKSSIISVSEIVNKMIEIWEEKSPPQVSTIKPHLHEAQVLMLDITKAKEKLQWKPCFDINEALINTVSWYKMYYNNAKSNEIKEYSLNQIENYCKKAEKLGLAWAKQNLKAYKNENRT